MLPIRKLVLALTALSTPLRSAAVILPTTNFECFECPGDDMGVVQLPTVNGVAGVKFFTKNPFNLFQEEGFAEVSFGTIGEFVTLPNASTVIPVSLQMNLSTTGSVVINEWAAIFQLIGGTEEEGQTVTGFAFFTGEGAGNFSDSGFMTMDGQGSINPGLMIVGVSLEIDFTGVGDIILNAPQSFNVGASADTSAVPEPASLLLAASGLLLIGTLKTPWRRHSCQARLPAVPRLISALSRALHPYTEPRP